MSSGAPFNNSNGSGSAHDDGQGGGGVSGAGFKVYGSVFKVDPRYELLNPLGKGSYGVVCAARDRETGQRMAIKKVCPMAKRSVDAKHTLREVLLLQLLGKHPNVISIHNLSTNLKDDELYIVMDLMDTDLHRVIQSSQTLSDSHVKYFLHQLLRGVKYLHDNGVLHRDLKPGNLLLTKTCQLKIADFGLARKALKPSTGSSASGVSSGSERPRSAPAMSTASRGLVDRAPMTEHVVTRWYRAPELMLQPDGLYGESVDMWSIGCIFAEILGRKALFPGKNFLHQLTLIFDVIGTPPPEATVRIKSSQAQRFLKSLGKKPKVPLRAVFPTASEEALDLLERLLEFDPEKRISAQDALAHPYMQPIEKKYKGVDPYPSARVDFSFDTKKLTKMDLRALIIKEVDTFRRSVAHAAAIDSEAAVDSAGTAPLTTKPTTTSQLNDRDKKRPASASAASVVSSVSTAASTQGGGRVMCGSAGISMINSAMRQRLASEQADGDKGGEDPAASSTTGFTNTTKSGMSANVSVMIGSNRPRIRMVTKPPVPKQPPLSFGMPALESHGLVRVVATQDTKSLLVSNANTEETPHKPEVEDKQTKDSDVFIVKKDSVVAAGVPAVHYNRAGQVAAKQHEAVTQDAKLPDTAKAAATAFSALEQRSRLLMQTIEAQPSQWAAPVASSLSITHKVTGMHKTTSMRPETSDTPSSRSKSPATSSSSTSSSDSDSERQRMMTIQQQQRTGNLTARVLPGGGEPLAPNVRRRVASAGPMRQKPNPSLHTSTAVAHKQTGGPTTFVGSTTSLIRAQRTNNGQSLADSADAMVATMAAKREEQQHQEEPWDESSGGCELKNQRSTTQLNQLDGVCTKKPGKKLTVPKSPKFSVMSWQKKKEMGVAARTGHTISRR